MNQYQHQLQLCMTLSKPKTSGQTFTAQYTLNGNGQEFYGVHVYFDVIFGSYAFSNVPSLSLHPMVSGVLSDHNGQAVPNAIVTLKTNDTAILTSTDATGRFKFHLPSLTGGHFALTLDLAATHINFEGSPISDVLLINH